MEKGVNIEGYITKSCKVEIINDFIFKVILTEEKKHPDQTNVFCFISRS